ncbi:MAG: MFS transporter [Butyrivibrio sp.]|jgi:MFS family permease|nr:MFS transporter [Butyrivibrio sp.]
MKLNYRRTILVGLAFLSICVFWQFYDNEIPKILKNTFHLGETWTGVIMALDNVLALFLLPFFGALSDKTHTGIGKRMPYILLGTALSVIFLMLLIGVANRPGRLALFIVILLCLLVSMGIYRSPAVSLMPDLTPAPLRSKANAVINLMGTVGAIYTLIMIKVLLKEPADGSLADYMPLALSIVVCMVITVCVLYLTISEKKLGLKDGMAAAQADTGKEENGAESTESVPMSAPVKKSMIFLLISVFLWFTAYNAVTTAFSRYVEQVWDLHNGAYADCLMVATIAAVLSYIPIGQISSHIGRKKTILIGVALMSICYLAGSFVPHFSFGINIMFAVIGFGWAAINVNSYPMVVEMSKAGDIGKFTGTYYTFSMAAQVFTPIFSGFLLEYVSYRTLFPYAFVFSTLAFITMLMVHHGDSRPVPAKSRLENFDVDD